MHLDEERIQRLLAGALSGPAAAAARAHGAECADCSRRLAAAEGEHAALGRLLASLDHPPPKVTAAELMARAKRPTRRWQRLAAGLAIALGVVGGAYAMPGSPLPGWVAAVVERVAGPTAPRELAPIAPSTEPMAPPAPAEAASGIAVQPGASLVIDFRSPAGEGEIQVSLVDENAVRVRAPAGAATFTAGADRILVDHPRSASYEIQIPRTAPRVEIQVDGRRLFLKAGSQVTTATPAGSGDEYILPLTASAP